MSEITFNQISSQQAKEEETDSYHEISDTEVNNQESARTNTLGTAQETLKDTGKNIQQEVSQAGNEQIQNVMEGTENISNALESSQQSGKESLEFYDAQTTQLKGTASELKETATTEVVQTVETTATKVEEVKENAKKNTDSIKEQTEEESSKIVEKIEESVAPAKSEATQKIEDFKDEATQKLNKVEEEIKAKEEQVLNAAKDKAGQAGKMAAAAGTMSSAMKGAISRGSVTECKIDKDEALHALTFVRNLHGADQLEWDEELGRQAQSRALYMAQTKSNQLSGTDDVGEIIYIAKGTSQCSKIHQAVLEWYKSITHFTFKSMTTPSDDCAPFTQLVWDDAKRVGIGCAYAEDTRTSFIVANFSPAGNYGDSRNYAQHVHEPTVGLPPRIPKLNELTTSSACQTTGNAPSNMGSIFGALCHWCTSLEEKPEIKIAGAKPKVFVKVNDGAPGKTDEKASDKEATSPAKKDFSAEAKEKERENEQSADEKSTTTEPVTKTEPEPATKTQLEPAKTSEPESLKTFEPQPDQNSTGDQKEKQDEATK